MFLHVLRERIFAILRVIDMEDFEMTMGVTFVPVLVRQYELSAPAGNSRAIHRVSRTFGGKAGRWRKGKIRW